MLTKLRQEIKNAMKEKNTVKRDVFKLVLAKAQAIAKEKKSEEITDDMIIQAGQAEIKQINQALELALVGGDFYNENLAKRTILEDFLPQMLGEYQIFEKVREYLKEMKNDGMDITNKGLVMKTLMPKFKGIADGKLVNRVISQTI